nr:factor H binding protein domain-containing protein [uncultured Kingella sp.]
MNLTWLQLANSGSARQEVTIDGKTYHYQDKHTSVDDDTINLADLGMGYSSRQIEYSVTPAKGALSIELDPSKKVTAKGVLTAYQRPYSVVFAEALPFFHDGVGSGTQPRFEEGCETSATATGCELFIHGDQIKTVGYSTPSETIEKFANNNQKFSYSGEAFTHAATPEKGTFNYQVAFGLDKFGLETATSSGSITGFNSLGDITLGSGILGGSQIIGGTATASKGGRIGEYKLGFFGPNAEEVAGSGYISNEGGKNTNFGFSGAR